MNWKTQYQILVHDMQIWQYHQSLSKSWVFTFWDPQAQESIYFNASFLDVALCLHLALFVAVQSVLVVICIFHYSWLQLLLHLVKYMIGKYQCSVVVSFSKKQLAGQVYEAWQVVLKRSKNCFWARTIVLKRIKEPVQEPTSWTIGSFNSKILELGFLHSENF